MQIKIGDIFDSKAQTLINTVNCVGVMGKGIAEEFKKRFPDMFKDYILRCDNKEVQPGVPYLYRSLFPPQIINFPTKDHWKSVSRIEDIERGLQILLEKYQEWEVTSIAIPPLGCGNGQLEWKAVGPLIYRYAQQMRIPVELYAPYGTVPQELTETFLAGQPGQVQHRPTQIAGSTQMSAWVGLVEILSKIESQPYHWPVGRTIFQKIAFIATREGLPTGLEHQRGSFGPFSKGLKNVQTKLVNENLLQEERLGQMFRVKVGPNFTTMRQKHEAQLSFWTAIINKTTDLFMRMNTNQAEITATVIYAADELKRNSKLIPNEKAVFNYVMNWKQKRKPPINADEVASAIRNLGILHWIETKFDAALPVPAKDFEQL